ncbi:MAG: hypothetical protein EB007_11870 [Betaproteobacteria bacterium]|nr:hypothetical protein [Betaproteobacteria bacterium]
MVREYATNAAAHGLRLVWQQKRTASAVLFCCRRGVFTDSMLDAYIDLKMTEVTRFRMAPHPVEYDMYYSL